MAPIRMPTKLVITLGLLTATAIWNVSPVKAQSDDSDDLDFLFEEEPQEQSERSGGNQDSAGQSERETSDGRHGGDPSTQQADNGGSGESAGGDAAPAGGRPDSPEDVDLIRVGQEDQGEPVQPSTPARRGRAIEEIVVTAQKREQSLSDVPVSVQAFSGDQLAAAGALNNLDLPKITPGLTVTQQVGYTTTYLRGVGSDAFLLADPSVVNYIDGIYFPFALTLVQDFGAVERVEVLKGPQGTLFGRNALGGAINVVTEDPNTETFGASLQTVYSLHEGDEERSKTRAHANVPITDWLAFSVSGIYNSNERHVNGRINARPDNPGGDGLPRDRDRAGRAKVRLVPTDWLDINLGAYRLERDGIGTLYSVNTEPSLLGQLVGIQPQDPFAGENNEDVFTDNVGTTYYGEVALDAHWFDIKLLGSDQLIESFQNYDFDGSSSPLALFEVDPAFADVQTAELQVTSNGNTWGASHFEWIFGAYYFRSTQGLLGFLQAATTNLDDGLIAGIELPEPLLSIVDGLVGNLPVPSGAIDFVGLIDTESVAYFGQGTLDIFDWLDVTLGARFQEEERILNESSAGLRTTGGQTVPIPGQSFSGVDDPAFRDTTTSFDPKVALNFRPGWSWLGLDPLAYVSWQTATKSSTFNVVNLIDDPEFVDPEKIEAWEVGYKTRFFGGLTQLNFALFDYTIENQQVQFVSLLQGGAVTFENAAEASIQGAEFQLVTRILPSIFGDLTLNAGGAYLDSVYESFPNGSGFNENTGLLTTNNDFSGNRVVRTPRFSGNAGLTQSFSNVFAGNLEVGVSYYYNSGFFYLAQNTSNVEEDAYDLLDARISYSHGASGVRVSAFASNLLGSEYNISRFPNDFGTNDAPAPKRTFGIRLNYDYQ
ncbi:MAG: TonB-dependent receptor [Algiphilus sp.]